MDENNWMRRIVGRKKVVQRKMDDLREELCNNNGKISEELFDGGGECGGRKETTCQGQ